MSYHERVKFLLCLSIFTLVQGQSFAQSALELIKRQQQPNKCDYGIQNYDDLFFPERFREMSTEMSQVEACIDLQVGETRVTDSNHRSPNYTKEEEDSLNRPFSVEQKYAVTNLGNNTYQVDFALDFIAHDTARIAQMNRKVKDCLTEANTNSTDSLGRKFVFKMNTPLEAKSIPVDKRPPLKLIRISEDDNIRGHSSTYNINFSCATILHELLHLMGLHDEYEETHIGEFVHNQSGRIIETDPASGQPDYALAGLLSRKAQGTLENYTFHSEYDCRSIPSRNTILKNNHDHYPSVISQDNSASDRLYMFEPAHTERILFPRCRTKAQKYLRCGRQAYSEARTVCEQKPNFCDDSSWLTDLGLINQ